MNEQITIKEIGTELITLPMAKVHMKYQGWNGMWKIAITNQIPAPCLIGLDLSEHVKSVLITHSQIEKKETPEEKM